MNQFQSKDLHVVVVSYINNFSDNALSRSTIQTDDELNVTSFVRSVLHKAHDTIFIQRVRRQFSVGHLLEFLKFFRIKNYWSLKFIFVEFDVVIECNLVFFCKRSLDQTKFASYKLFSLFML